MGDRPVLVVVYDYGSLAPTRLAGLAAANECELVFLVPDSPHGREVMPILEALAPVVPMAPYDGRSERDVLGRDVFKALTARKPQGIVTFSESRIGDTARVAAALGLPYQAPEAIPAITGKDAQRAKLATRGVEAVRHRLVSDPAQASAAVAEVGLPLVVKPVLGASSRNTFAVEAEAEAHAAIVALLTGSGDRPAAEPAVLVEEYLPGRPTSAPWGDYIAVDCVARGDHVEPVFVTSKFALAEPFRERGGYGARSIVPDAELAAIRDLARRAVAALDIRHGIADVEIKLTPDGPRVLEINGRLGAWVDELAVRSGYSDPGDIAVKAALGRDHPVVPAATDGPIAFHYLLIPPPSATAVRAVRDTGPLRSIPNVDAVRILARPGADVGWRRGTASQVAAVAGLVDTHKALAETVARIEAAEWIEYEVGGGEAVPGARAGLGLGL
jgi:hypothetical protein